MADFDPDKYLEKKKKSEPFDPDKYLANTAPVSTAQSMGRGLASGIDTILNAVTGTLDYAAYPLARAFGRSPEQATAETTSPKDIVGRMFGVAGTPQYENTPLRRLGRAVGETVGENVVQPIASVTGLPEQDVGSMVTSATMGLAPAVPKVVKPVVQAGKTTGQFFGQIPGGMLGRATGYIAKPGETPKGIQVESSRIPLTETFTRPEDWAKFQRGELPYGQFPQETPISQLPTNAIERGALKLSGGEIPAQGKAGRAFGERLGETYRNPVTGVIDVLSMFNPYAPGVPLVTAARGGLAGVQGFADYLLARKGFDPNLPKQMEMYRSGQMPMPGTPPTAGPVAPQLGYTPSPVIPAATQPRTVNIEGQSYNLPYQINTSQAQTARAPQTATPVPDLAQLAAQRSAQEAARSSSQVRQTAAQQVTGPVDPTGILAQIRARGAQPGQMTSMPPAPAPAPAPATGGSLFDPQNFNKLSDKDKLSVLRQRMSQEPQQTMTAAQEKQMRSQITESSKATSQDIINDFASKGSSEKAASTTPIDTGKDAYNGSRATQGMAKALIKKGIDEIPVIQGMSESQVINAIHSRISKKKGPGNVSQMLVGEPKDIKALEQSLVSKRQFNEDLQKYRYGTEKNPLTVDEAVHLLESDFLPKQELVDNMMGRKTDLTEYSIWYRDETGKAQNVQTYGGELKKIR